jgi:hypothetical protein
MEFKQVQELPLGEFVKRKEDSGKVYRRGPYDRTLGRYQLDDVEDISRAIYVKKGTALFVGFTY